MKVLVISHMYPSTFNESSGIFVHKQMKSLIEQGCDIKVICPVPWAPFPINKFSGKWKRYSQIPRNNHVENIKVYYPRYIEFPKGYFFDKSGYMMYKGIKKLALKLHQKYKFDLIHSHVAFPDGFSGMLLNENIKLPHIVTVHGQDFQNTIYRNEKCRQNLFKVMNKVDRVIAVSNKLKNIVKGEEFIDKLEVVNNGIDIQECTVNNDIKVKKPKNSILILSVSNLYKPKGIDLNIKAIAKLVKKYPNILYYIIGDGVERKNLERLVCDNNLSDNVVFLGRLNHDKVMSYMSICDIFSLPSWKEGFGVVYIEAMAHAKPVIGVRGEGMEDAIINKENGLLVEPKDIDSLVEALQFLIDNKQKALKIGKLGKETVINDFTWKKNAKKMLEVYEILVKK